MTPGARLQAAVEILSAMDADPAAGDGVVRSYFRMRRYIGSGDRRDISSRVWRTVRYRSRLSWRLDQEKPSARLLILGDSLLNEGQEFDTLDGICSGEGYAPAALDETERSVLSSATVRVSDEMPAHVATECPDWLWPYFTDLFGDQAETELAALSEEAPVDLRVNTLKADRATAAAALEAEGLDVENTGFAPHGLRMAGRVVLANSKTFANGLVEVQDEGSQLAAALVDVKPEQDVLDLCAGGGGKTLAMAAAMGGSGRIIATDNDARRLNRAKPRLKRAGVFSVTTRVLDPENTNWLHKKRKSFDRVLVDAPCSGTGAWRRNPDARWRLTPKDLSRHIETQDAVLTQGGRMTKPGGRLIYVTCSLLRQENEDRVEHFLERHEHFRALSAADIWKSVVGTRYPGRGKYLRLSPRRHQTDGFFIAVLQRKTEG
ncbi:MAG: RsmB/NOP family class I SAM-dependent RNA methyltransferase [Rhodospirillaceae bacterium]|nr:RsmB/NOP family class I SAM-dependent RNA methyltransferase [Rhodospirillaceae bacterium]